MKLRYFELFQEPGETLKREMLSKRKSDKTRNLNLYNIAWKPTNSFIIKRSGKVSCLVV